MTLFDYPTGADQRASQTSTDAAAAQPESVKRPRRWSLANWPVRWKVFAIALVPLVLAAAFGGLRIYNSTIAARDLRVAADRAEMVPEVASYMGSLETALVVTSSGEDAKSAVDDYTSQRTALQQKLDSTDVIPDVRLAVTTLLNYGKDLLDKVSANSVSIRQQVTGYAPLLLTSETAITGSVQVNDENVRLQAEGLARAVGSRGQMTMQKMLVQRGGELPEPELRTSMITLAGTEPSTVTAMSKLLGGTSDEAATLRSQMVVRMGLMSDPSVQLVENPDLLKSLQATEDIADKVISTTTGSITSTVDDEATAQRNAAIRDAAAVLAAILLAMLIVWLVARSLTRPLRRLRDGALRVAHEDLPKEIERVHAGDDREPPPLPIHTTEEVGQVAHAVDELHTQALLLAGDEARLRLMVNDMFETMSRRNKSLVDQQLSLIDRLERNEDDPDRLDSLFRLDHLATRMRRNGANLLVLAGAQVSRDQTGAVPLASVVSAAASEVEDYRRVDTGMVPDCSLVGAAAGDTVHLLAELIDNALRYSPPTAQVRVSAVYTSNRGLLIDVDDAGLGMTEADLRIANMRLGAGGEVSPESTRHMGLFVVGRLAREHGMIVRLRTGAEGTGTTAEVYAPPELLVGSESDKFVDTGGMPVVTAADLEAHADTPVEQHAQPEPVAAEPELLTPPSPVVPAAFFRPATDTAEGVDAAQRNGSEDASVTLLPRRTPGSSGITGDADDDDDAAEEAPWWSDVDERPEAPAETPSNTSGFFSARARVDDSEVAEDRDVAEDGTVADVTPLSEDELAEEVADDDGWQIEDEVSDEAEDEAAEPIEEPLEVPVARVVDRQQDAQRALTDTGEIDLSDMDALAEALAAPKVTTSGVDLIYQNMVSEWLVDPHELAIPQDWKSVWDNGWEAAAEAENVPVKAHTDHGLPVRAPGARLIPGGANGIQNGEPEPENGVPSNGLFHSGDEPGDREAPERNPEAIRASISNHFGGVRAGRTHARETTQGREHE